MSYLTRGVFRCQAGLTPERCGEMYSWGPGAPTGGRLVCSVRRKMLCPSDLTVAKLMNARVVSGSYLAQHSGRLPT